MENINCTLLIKYFTLGEFCLPLTYGAIQIYHFVSCDNIAQVWMQHLHTLKWKMTWATALDCLLVQQTWFPIISRRYLCPQRRFINPRCSFLHTIGNDGVFIIPLEMTKMHFKQLLLFNIRHPWPPQSRIMYLNCPQDAIIHRLCSFSYIATAMRVLMCSSLIVITSVMVYSFWTQCC